ncbi:MAG: hypothetical protein CMF46_00160 [Legionellales bacterium]|nr:hypothetical protein [Legionellales bacterium]
MEYFPELQDLETTKKLIIKINSHFEKYGYTVYATIRKDSGEFIGFIGLFTLEFESHFTPATEIGWRLSSTHWGKGLQHDYGRNLERTINTQVYQDRQPKNKRCLQIHTMD